MSEYSVEEVRQAQEVIALCYEVNGEPPRWAVDRVTTALAERIKADEGVVPCPRCNGAGEYMNYRGNMSEMEWCHVCEGTGKRSPPAQANISISKALNTIEEWGQQGNELHGDDVERFRALADKIAPAQVAQVDKPPRLGGCCCGEPCTLGVVHRTDGPCFHYVEHTAEPVVHGEVWHEEVHGMVKGPALYDGQQEWVRKEDAQPRAVPDGWVLVPCGPTSAMLEAALSLQGEDAALARAPALLSALLKIYRAMLAAAPSQGESA